jgi:hypothetical protein|tara:strand:- start:2481 stop:2636 length:156 start_codon:yes stop_codon:yes gene_type:complete
MIGLSPKEFWDSSISEITFAIKGFSEFNGSGKDKPMSKDELENLMELNPDE